MNLAPKSHGIYLEYDKNTEVDFSGLVQFQFWVQLHSCYLKCSSVCSSLQKETFVFIKSNNEEEVNTRTLRSP